MPQKELKPIRTPSIYFERMEYRIIQAFKKFLYNPLLKDLAPRGVKLRNAIDDLLTAMADGRVTYYHGKFSGSFDAAISRELKKLGATWKNGAFHIQKEKLPYAIRSAITINSEKYKAKIDRIDKKIASIIPADIVEGIKTADLFDKALWQTEKDFEKTLKGIAVAPQLNDEQRAKIAAEWQNNMDLFIKDFAEEEIKALRESIKESVFSGNRYEDLVQSIKFSYGVTTRKAKFLARQETNLMMAKYKEVKYTEAGIEEYKWQCVTGTPAHPVRPMHKALDGSIQRWDKPPVTDQNGSRNHPGTDYNCRCVAVPIVKF